jgi:hypothetical protein
MMKKYRQSQISNSLSSVSNEYSLLGCYAAKSDKNTPLFWGEHTASIYTVKFEYFHPENEGSILL